RAHGGLDDPRDGAGRPGFDAALLAQRLHHRGLRDLRPPPTAHAGRRYVREPRRAPRSGWAEALLPGRGAQSTRADRRGYAAADHRAPGIAGITPLDGEAIRGEGGLHGEVAALELGFAVAELGGGAREDDRALAEHEHLVTHAERHARVLLHEE